MKKRLIISSLLLSSGLAIASGTYANTEKSPTATRRTPPGYSELSESEKQASEDRSIKKDLAQTASGEIHLDVITLTEGEKTALESMTEVERSAFFESKGLTHMVETGSGKSVNPRDTLTSRTTRQSDTYRDSEVKTGDRAERIRANNAKLLEAKKLKIQKKVSAGESLSRLEKKFATANGIEYS